MNMISTGAFLNGMDASTKQETISEKFVTRAWEKKNAKAARAGGVSLMALSLAACGSGDDTTTTTETTTTTTTTPVVAAVSKTLTTSVDTISGADLTSAADTITATSATMAATDAVVDTRTGDGDTMNITLTAANNTATILTLRQ